MWHLVKTSLSAQTQREKNYTGAALPFTLVERYNRLYLHVGGVYMRLFDIALQSR